ncbi:hypothetical protein IEQ34_010790 [Dendrobium chrysotoxum]|uniref:t-SNARE coiled-coil homology domain-containing protein n=1 Tax=Dendrobium chrysotoxum TaxID=161865 RepID=A0AAV7GX35_DENCH|nr:hypothetical protein IEQ34_010790 [Dendrobium chrysotoxum]
MNNLMTKSFLNYAELKKQALKDETTTTALDLETGRHTGADEDNLSLFFQEVSNITTEMESISNLLLDLHRLNQDSKSTHSPKLLRGMADQMDSDMANILRKANIINLQLKVLDESNTANRQISPVFSEGSAVDRTRIFVTGAVRNKLRGMMNEFQELRERVVADHREGLKRRYFAATGELPNEEVIDGMIYGNEGENLVLVGKKSGLGLEAEERRRAVEEIRRSLNKLQTIFLDMAVLVEKQGEELNDIEGHMACAKSFVSGGTGQLAEALRERKKKRKRQRFLCFCAVAAAVLLVLLVLSFVE